MAGKVFRGDRMRQARESLGLTQVDLASRLKTHQAQIYRYENGVSEPLPEQIVRLARELQVSADWLLGLTHDSTDTMPEKTLSPQERRFLEALRHGNFRRLLNLIQEAIPEDEEDSTITDEVASDSNPLNGG